MLAMKNVDPSENLAHPCPSENSAPLIVRLPPQLLKFSPKSQGVHSMTSHNLHIALQESTAPSTNVDNFLTLLQEIKSGYLNWLRFNSFSF